MAKPKVRSIGFEGEWIKKSYAETFCFLKHNSLSRAELDIQKGSIKNIHYGDILVRFDNILDVNKESLPYIADEALALKLVKDCRIQNGDIIFADAAEDNTVGKCVEIVSRNEDALVSGLHTIPSRPLFEFSGGYLGYSLNANSYHNQLLTLIQGTKISSISKSALQKTIITFPATLSEQQQIASYFMSLDSLIQATMKKIFSLKQLKSASFLSMFPQAGETKPRVRFRQFEGEWVKKKLSGCLEVSDDRNLEGIYGRNDVLSVSDDFGVMNQIELLGRSYAGKSVANYGILRTGEIVYTKSPLKSKPFGIIKQNMDKTGIVSVLYAIYKAKEGTAPEYIHYYFDPEWRLNAYMRPLVSKGAKNTMNISDEMALTGSIWIPSSLDEQQHIASYFRALDTQISLETQRLEKLKQIKSTCLDKMFV